MKNKKNKSIYLILLFVGVILLNIIVFIYIDFGLELMVLDGVHITNTWEAIEAYSSSLFYIFIFSNISLIFISTISLVSISKLKKKQDKI